MPSATELLNLARQKRETAERLRRLGPSLSGADDRRRFAELAAEFEQEAEQFEQAAATLS